MLATLPYRHDAAQPLQSAERDFKVLYLTSGRTSRDITYGAFTASRVATDVDAVPLGNVNYLALADFLNRSIAFSVASDPAREIPSRNETFIILFGAEITFLSGTCWKTRTAVVSR